VCSSDLYDASTGTPALTTSPTPVSGCTSVRDMQLTHDGTDVLVSCSTPAAVLSLNASTLTEDASYAGLTGEHAAAGITSADAGAVAAGFEAASQKDVFVYTRGGTFVRSYGFGTDALAVDGLQFGAAGTLYAVTHNSGSTTWRLHVLHDATRFAVQLTALMSAAHSPPALHDPITVSGKLLSAASPLSGGETVHLVRKDLAGIHDVADATTDGTGSFSFAPDTPNDGTEDIGGPVTYTASWPGDATHRPGVVSVSANIPRWPTSLTVRTNRTTYAHGGLATVTAHLGQTLNSRKVAIYMTPYGGSKVLLKNADVDANGNLRVSHRVYKRTTFSARFVGDFLYAPAHASTVAQVHGLVTEALAGSYGTSGAYHLYHLTSNPVLRARLYPNLDDVCLYFRAQRYSSGAWHTVATSSCVRTNSLGKAAGALTGNHLTGNPYRLRAEWRGNSIALAFNGPWMRLKFTA